MSSRSSLARQATTRALSAGALVLTAFMAFGATGSGCGSGTTDEYRCDSTGCFDCDGFGCRAVDAPTAPPCGFAGDTTCTANTVCTEIGCLTQCKADAECAKGLVCKSGLCSPPTGTKTPEALVCADTADCTKLGAGALCVDGKCVTAPACTGAECTCKYSSECGDGRLCVDGKCAVACGAGAPACPTGYSCGDKGFCVAAAPTCGPDANGATCKTGEKCVEGHCAPQCTTNETCLDGSGKPDPTQVCVGGACVPDTRTDPKCTGDTQCAAGTQKCVNGFCRYTCTDDASCMSIDARIGTCAATEKICRSADEVAATCTAKADCAADKSCVDGQCK